MHYFNKAIYSESDLNLYQADSDMTQHPRPPEEWYYVKTGEK